MSTDGMLSAKPCAQKIEHTSNNLLGFVIKMETIAEDAFWGLRDRMSQTLADHPLCSAFKAYVGSITKRLGAAYDVYSS